MKDIDLLVRGGLVVDGQRSAHRADIAISEGRVVATDAPADARAARVLDATGLVISPGFIDTHTHGEFIDLSGPEDEDLALAPLRQGVTTQIVGNCGFSAFGTAGADTDAVRAHVAGLFGTTARAWQDFDAYRHELERAGLHLNLGSLVGHGSLHVGSGTATPDAVRAAVRDGALGLSSGLVYRPGREVDTDSLVSAARGLGGSGLPYVTHVRGETHDVVRSIDEALDIGRRAEVPVHISHHKVAGRANWGAASQTLTRIDQARSEGLDVTMDVYPYTASSTSLHSLLPPWASHGGPAEAGRQLAHEAAVQRLRQDIEDGLPDWENMIGAAGWDRVRIARAPGLAAVDGMDLAALARAWATDPAGATGRLLGQVSGSFTVVFDVLNDRDIDAILTHPAAMVGSDGIPLPGKPHPRWAGSFARVLGHYVRDRGLLTLDQAVAKCSLLGARRFGLADRGHLDVGAAGDLVVFSPEEVMDGATFTDPITPPTGVVHVVVNGSVVIDDQTPTGARPGKVLRSMPPATARPPRRPLRTPGPR
jgi:N-acyl-D-amino-acid deacylase